MPISDTYRRVSCPSCQQKARKVGTVTLAALLKNEFASPYRSGGESCCGASGCQPVTGSTGWRFCASQTCDTVYFAEDGDESFVRSQLKVPVGVKETTGDRPLCYCFGHSVASIKKELVETGKSNALEDIRAKMKDPGCRCETENPAGSCCLGSVAKGIDVGRTELGMNDSDGSLSSPKPLPNRGERIAKVGTIISAILGSSCCWLPLVLLAVGVSGAGIASTLEAYRPVFMTITFGFLGAAFYFTYRPRTSGGQDCCASESAYNDCCDPAKNRINMMALNKAMLWLVTVLAIAILFFPSYVGAFLGSDNDSVVPEDMHKTVIEVEGMTCDGCSALVAEAIRTSPEVLAVEVSYESSNAIVGTADSEFPAQRILTSLKDAGYSGYILDEQSSSKLKQTRQEER